MPPRAQPNKARRGRGKPRPALPHTDTTASNEVPVESAPGDTDEIQKSNEVHGSDATMTSVEHATDPNGIEHSLPVQLPNARDTRSRKTNKNHTSIAPDTNSTQGTNRNANSKSAKAPSAQTPLPKDSNPTGSRLPVTDIFGETPERYYAGPSFRNSPAASTLPLPKFFSRSVPNVDQFPSEAGKGSRSNTLTSGDSPRTGSATPERTQLGREDSPLNILFRSDREAKAKASQTRPSILPSKENTSSSHSLPGLNESPLGSRGVRNHTRHNTDGGPNGVFSLEMDNDIPYNQERAVSNSHQENERKAPVQDSTSALKKLLNFSENQSVPKPVSGGDFQNSGTPSTPSPKSRSQARSSARLSGNPPLFPSGLDGSTPEQRHAALLALAEKQIQTPASQRPPSSTLRKEIKLPTSPTIAQDKQSPSTPTTKRAERQSTNTRSQRAPATTGHISTYPSMHAGNARPTLNSSAKDPAMKSMEDDLRRILKLDELPSGGVSGVQS